MRLKIDRTSLILLRLLLAVSVAYCPLIRTVAPVASGQLAPFEESEKEQTGEEIALVSADNPSPTHVRKTAPRVVRERTVRERSVRFAQVTPPLAFPDPFRNGLGTPFRC